MSAANENEASLLDDFMNSRANAASAECMRAARERINAMEVELAQARQGWGTADALALLDEFGYPECPVLLGEPAPPAAKRIRGRMALMADYHNAALRGLLAVRNALDEAGAPDAPISAETGAGLADRVRRLVQKLMKGPELRVAKAVVQIFRGTSALVRPEVLKAVAQMERDIAEWEDS